ncbi:Nn.00g062140.m01.CDS01 [Neocucurbitaria sp. VM-36]
MHRERPYDIVHLDMHGKIDVGSALPAATPYLRFGRHYKENLAPFPKNKDPIAALMEDDSSLSDIEVDRVAALLREYRITKIALSACLSSYAQYDMLANMCHVFLSHGASHISAMSFQVLEKTAQIYYAAFYQALLVNGQSFLSAAAVGREALRAQPQSANALVPTSYHLRGRVSTGDFWPEYRLRLAWLPLVVAYCLRLGALLGIILGATPTLLPLYASILWSDLSEQCSGNGSLASISLAGIIWYGSVRWVHRLQCPLWLWIPHPLTIFHPRENLRLLSGHVEIEHLVLEDRLEFGASRGAIYLWNGDPDADLDRVIAGLCRVWVCTGFFDSIDVVPAMVFMSSLSYRQWWLRLRITRHKSDAPNSVGLGRRRLVVVTDFDHLYDSYHRQQDIATGKISDVALKDFEDALGRMAYFINHYGVSLSDSDSGDTDSDEISVAETDVDVDAGNVRSRNGLVIGKPYLIITGSFSDPKWRKLRWPTEEIINTIGRTIPHLHDVSPSQQ